MLFPEFDPGIYDHDPPKSTSLPPRLPREDSVMYCHNCEGKLVRCETTVGVLAPGSRSGIPTS